MVDLRYRRDGLNIVVLTPVTDAGRAWVDDNVISEAWQWLGPSLAIDTRNAGDLLTGAAEAGLEVAEDD